MPGLTVRTVCGHADRILDVMRKIPVAGGKSGILRVRPCFDNDSDFIEALDSAKLDDEMGRQPFVLENDFLDLAWKHVDAAHDHHVVGTACDLLHPAHRTRRTGQQTRRSRVR